MKTKGIVLGTGSVTTRFQSSQEKGTLIVFVNSRTECKETVFEKTKSGTNSFDEIKERNCSAKRGKKGAVL